MLIVILTQNEEGDVKFKETMPEIVFAVKSNITSHVRAFSEMRG